jgi:ubiquinone/menaquinone biosynthesis C-methylase UbiE
MTGAFDPVGYKEIQRTQWREAAAGWRRWYDVLEGGSAVVSRLLVDQAGIGPGDAVLDLGSGYGEPALSAARLVAPGGRVVATDIAPNMLDFARERAVRAGVANVEFVTADAEVLSFADETFDAIVSRQALQFLPNVAATLARLNAFLKRDGRLAAAVWGPPDTVEFAHPVPLILEELNLPAPEPGRPGAFALGDPGRLSRLVCDAGFREVETGTVTVVFETGSPEEFTQFIRDVAPPIANLVNGQPPQVQDQVWRKVTEEWAPYLTTDGHVRTENQAIWVAGTR